jgi:exonuclease SbcC
LIRSELELVRKQYDGNTLEPLRAAISDLFGKMTGGKYEIPRLDEYVPAEISGKAGVLNINLLSTGTLDALALAVRLAMAKELLSGRQGFVIMDDPLINLDPDRKKASAEAIKSFATDGRQVVLFTCDPEHARLFGVNAVQLGEANMGKEPG